MKSSSALLVFGYSLLFSAGGLSDERKPAGLQDANIVWSVSTNQWPEKLWVYKVVPQEFSEAVVSNLMTLGSFTTNDQTKTPDYLSTNDPETIYFRKDLVNHLAICPSLGFIEYHDNEAQAKMVSSIRGVPEPVVGVPNEKESTELALKYIRLCGINVAQLATKPGTDDLDIHWDKGTRSYIDTVTGKAISETNNYGVWLSRRIDGIRVHGFGGMDISFGNNAKVIDLQLCWRNLKCYELHDFPSLQQVVKWIRDGKITMHPLGSIGVYSPQRIQKLTITKATPLYDGKYYDQPMNCVAPYASFEAIANDGKRTTALWFESKMTPDKKQADAP